MNAQGSPEWAKERAGHCTASRFADVLAKIKVGEAAGRRNYRTQLVSERCTGLPASSFSSKAMQWGIDTEAAARLAYEAMTGEPCIVTGFHRHPKHEWVGCSPDGLVGDDGLAQFKCPESHTHLQYMLDGACPSDYIAQVQGEMWVTGRAWSDFVSFDPRFIDKSQQMLVVRVPRDDAYIEKLEAEVLKFLREVDQMHNRVFTPTRIAA